MKKMVRVLAIMLLSLLVLTGMVACQPEAKVEPEPTPTPTPAPKPEPKASIKFRANMMGSASATNTAEGNVASSTAMSSDSYIDVDGAIHGTFYLVDNSKFTAFWGEGKTGSSYYALYELNIDALTAGSEGSSGTYLFYVKTSSENGTVKKEYGTSKSRAKCTVLGNSAEDAAKLKIEYYVIDGTYNKIYNTEFTGDLPEAQKALIEGKTPVVTITVAKDAVFKNAQPAYVKFKANMMGSASATETADGNFASSAAMSSDSYIDADGALHGTFTAIDNSKFTAFWGEGKTGSSYYALYELNIDALTAGSEGSSGTYLFYVKTSSENGTVKKEYGTSKSRAKCTVLGNSAEDAAKLKIEYYVIDGTYNKINNTEFTGELPEAQKALIEGKTPAVTFTVAEDAVFTK